MKKILVAIGSLFLTTAVYAVSTTTPVTPTGAATPGATVSAQLDSLKNRLASAATQLSQSQKRAVFGIVKSTSVSTIIVETKTSEIKIELADTVKVAQVIKGKRTDLTTDDVSKGDTVVVFGDYDANLDLLKAKVIFIEGVLPTRINGTITDSSKKDFTITVTTVTGQAYIVDIESTTKNTLWNKTDGTSKGAFSKLVIGDTVSVLGTLEAKTDNRISALRILDIGNLTGVTPTPTPAIASPSATLKITPKPTGKPTATPTP